MVDAILTQNTNWLNVGKTFENLPSPIIPNYIEKAGVDEMG